MSSSTSNDPIANPEKSEAIPSLVLDGIQEKYGRKDYRNPGDAEDGGWDPYEPLDATSLSLSVGVRKMH